jgi:hypothetical protein
MNKAKKGSIVIMILILMTALVAIIHSLLRSTSYLALIAQDRKIIEQQYLIDKKI